MRKTAEGSTGRLIRLCLGYLLEGKPVSQTLLDQIGIFLAQTMTHHSEEPCTKANTRFVVAKDSSINRPFDCPISTKGLRLGCLDLRYNQAASQSARRNRMRKTVKMCAMSLYCMMGLGGNVLLAQDNLTSGYSEATLAISAYRARQAPQNRIENPGTFNPDGLANYVKGSMHVGGSVIITHLEDLRSGLARWDQRFQEYLYDNPMGRLWRGKNSDPSKAIVDTSSHPMLIQFQSSKNGQVHNINCRLDDDPYMKRVWITNCKVWDQFGKEIEFGFPKAPYGWLFNYSDLNSDALKGDPRTSELSLIASFSFEGIKGEGRWSPFEIQERHLQRSSPQVASPQ